ncbi:MAG: hypothetical protein P4L99_01830 [Chthoniobacter sp.]|nr:hypothetical protein [Chthoniobacter sp.]
MPRTRAFTILEVALIVAIIGMMLMMIFGYLLAPKKAAGPLPPIQAQSPFIETPAPSTPQPKAAVAPASSPLLTMPVPAPPASTPTETATPVAPAPAPAAATPVPQTIDLSPQSSPIFR